MSTVKVNMGAINRVLAGRAGGGALGSAGIERIVTRMIAAVKAEMKASGINERSGELADSFVPIVVPDPRGGVRVGVGSTSETAKWLTEGTVGHPISVPFVGGRPAYSLRSNGPRSKGYNPTPLRNYPIYFVNHPGNKANDFIRRGVNAAIGRPSF